MNSKKNKGKNRARPTKNAEETETIGTLDKIDSTEEAVRTESLMSVEENRIPSVLSEPISIVENDSLCDTPKKPKRNKGKRKKDTMVEGEVKDADQIREIILSDTDIKENLESLPVIASVRKKKKKGKKQEEQMQEKEAAKDLFITQHNDKDVEQKNIGSSLTDEDINSTKQEISTQILQKEDSTQKKKKKKKHRHDSEKSDKSDPCILAFQELLQSSSGQTDVNIDSDAVEGIINDEKEPNKVQDDNRRQNITEDFSKGEDKLNIETETENKNSKRRNKKGKKQPKEANLYGDTSFETVITEQLIQNISHEEVTFSDNAQKETSIKEKSPKPKAIIVKPVQKKRKPKVDSDILEDSNILRNNTELSNDGEKLTIQLVNDPVIDNLRINKEEHKSDIQAEAIDVTSSKTDDYNLASESSNNLFEGQIEVPVTVMTDQCNSDIIQIEMDKYLSDKNNISLVTPEIIEEKDITPIKEADNIKKSDLTYREEAEIFYDVSQTDIVESGIKSEECDMKKISTPDLIEYPRSTSQQLLDDNNNTFIQEITTTEEIKLDIPTYIPKPIIQGSGESPEVKIPNEPIIASCAINVTEIVSSPDLTNILLQPSQGNREKTDIKSKMIEVNRDMEELRLSIERSLAGLTAVEKDDSEVEKEFEELFQSQNTKPLVKNIEASIPQVPKELEKETELNVSQSKETKLNVGLNETQKSESTTSHSKDSSETKESLKTSDMLDKTEEISNETDTKNMNANIARQQKEISGKEPISCETSRSNLEDNKDVIQKSSATIKNAAPICPARRDKGKSKSKKKGKKEVTITSSSTPSTTSSTSQTATSTGNNTDQKEKKNENSGQKSESSQTKGKQQSLILGYEAESIILDNPEVSFEPIDNFEDALTSSAEDVNKTFEIIANEATSTIESLKHHNNPQINIIAPTEDTEKEKKRKNEEKKQKQNPVSQPKNLLGHPNIPASSNKTDYKKERNKTPNSIQAKVKIKDSVEIENAAVNQSKESQGDSRKNTPKGCDGTDSYSYAANGNDDLVYKYTFRKVFLQSLCHICKKNLVQRVPCKFCSLVFYCSQKHKDEDWPQHQSLCFAVSTIAHLKEQKHIYSDARNITGYDYRVLRMQMILSCEKILKRKLVPWEQEALLYPRICADVNCREWRQSKLKDCEGCGQISYCIEHSEHLPTTHQRWCKSYALYQKLVNYQRTKGRLEPRLPTKVLEHYQIPGKLNEVLGSMYEEKIDMDDIQYAALTQIATVPLTVAYSHQLFTGKINSSCANGMSKVKCLCDLRLRKWNKILFMYLHTSAAEVLQMIIIGPDLNPSSLPLDLLAKIKLCENCQTNKRRVVFDFHVTETYQEYYSSNDFVTPDIVCTFNPSIHRSSAYNPNSWPATINCILKQRIPFVLTSYTQEELRRDLGKIRECARVDFNVVSEIKYNPFSSMRPDRNFITDDEMPLLFKNYCFSILCGTF